ncbi:hypothetical protein RRG08_016657 [Elysia crispata]|uniref:Uncharacterized protein n=1 Tax=Elysia crispata TaxID=231223 RepID=A0AAE0Z273_9GAST|nr:hypothetical protein RRG08_016657 [Elysia crispata]
MEAGRPRTVQQEHHGIWPPTHCVARISWNLATYALCSKNTMEPGHPRTVQPEYDGTCPSGRCSARTSWNLVTRALSGQNMMKPSLSSAALIRSSWFSRLFYHDF